MFTSKYSKRKHLILIWGIFHKCSIINESSNGINGFCIEVLITSLPARGTITTWNTMEPRIMEIL